ncbi:hypothetical protein RJJ65_38020, partial [Rhizobium hidalgonense]
AEPATTPSVVEAAAPNQAHQSDAFERTLSIFEQSLNPLPDSINSDNNAESVNHVESARHSAIPQNLSSVTAEIKSAAPQQSVVPVTTPVSTPQNTAPANHQAATQQPIHITPSMGLEEKQWQVDELIQEFGQTAAEQQEALAAD